jgi:hypothetical protein
LEKDMEGLVLYCSRECQKQHWKKVCHEREAVL